MTADMSIQTNKSMTRTEDAVLYFADGFACTPAVFTVFGKEMGLSDVDGKKYR